MAVSGSGLDHRHCAVFHHAPDQPRSSSGDQHIQVSVEAHESCGRLPSGIGDELDRVLGDPAFFQSVPDTGDHGTVGIYGVAASP